MAVTISESKKNKFSFDTLLPRRLSKQAKKITKRTSQSLFRKLTVKSSVAMPGIKIPAESLNMFSVAARVTQQF